MRASMDYKELVKRLEDLLREVELYLFSAGIERVYTYYSAGDVFTRAHLKLKLKDNTVVIITVDASEVVNRVYVIVTGTYVHFEVAKYISEELAQRFLELVREMRD